MAEADLCPTYSAFFSQAGVSLGIILAAFGAAYGTAKSGVTVILTGTEKPATIMKTLLPVIMAGILTIYGLIIGMYIALVLDGTRPVSFYSASLHLCAGLIVGTASLSAGFAIGRLGDAGVRAFVREPRLFMAMILLLVCGEILGIYGLVCSGLIITNSKTGLYC